MKKVYNVGVETKTRKLNIVRNYPAVFEQDSKSRWYTAFIPALPGCISQGKNFEEAMKNIQEAAELYLEVISKKDKDELKKDTSRVIVAPIQLAI